MFLVKFYDDVLYVCHSKDINIKKSVIKVKYNDDFTYFVKYFKFNYIYRFKIPLRYRKE